MKLRLIDNLAYSSTPLDNAAAWILKALLLFMPLALGAVQAWSELVVVIGALALAGLLSLRVMVNRQARFTWSYAIVPLGLFAALVMVQLLPLPGGLIGLISPATLRLRGELLADIPSQPGDWIRLSFYPYATAHGLRLVLVVAIVFLTTINIFRRTEQIRSLLAWIIGVGAAVAMIALVQDFRGDGLIYGFVPTSAKSAGPFQNYNHLSQFLNLSIGAGLGLILTRLHEELGRDCSLPRLLRHLKEPELRPLIWLAALITLCASAIFLSMSRMGMISCVAGLVAVGTLLNITGHTTGRGWLLSLIGLAIFSAILLLGFDAVYARLATLENLSDRYRDRWQILSDLLPVWRQFPLLGVGLGTHETFFPMFDRSGDMVLSTHAENNYAQMAEEVGMLGVGLILTFLGILAAAVVRVIRSPDRPISAAAFALAGGLLAVVIHSWTDFGQHLTAVSCLTAVVAGMIIRLARDRDRQARHTPSPEIPAAYIPSGVPQYAFCAIVICSMVWATWTAGRSCLAENAWAQASQLDQRLKVKGRAGTDEEYDQLIAAASSAASWEPGNVAYQFRLNLARWNALSRNIDAAADQPALDANGLLTARDIISQLTAARQLCPTYGPVCSVAGQIDRLLFSSPSGTELIRRAYRLTPHDPTVIFAAGVLEGEEGNWDQSLACFRRIRGSGFQNLARYYTDYFERPDLAVALAEDDPGYLLQVARALDTSGNQQPLAAQCRQQALKQLKSRFADLNASPSDIAQLGYIFRDEKDYSQAIACFRRALDHDYGQVHWRLALAQSLAASGDREAAIREARICLRLRPQLAPAQALIADVSTRKVSAASELR